jgi:hypothetical protein
MNRILLLAGGLLDLLLAIFKIAMPYLFHWREAMSSKADSMWAILYAENLGISLLLLFFAYMSIFQWQELLKTNVGRTLLLSIGSLWIFRTIAEIALFKIGVDGTWWRVFLFLIVAAFYLLPLRSVIGTSFDKEKLRSTPQSRIESHE